MWSVKATAPLSNRARRSRALRRPLTQAFIETSAASVSRNLPIHDSAAVPDLDALQRRAEKQVFHDATTRKTRAFLGSDARRKRVQSWHDDEVNAPDLLPPVSPGSSCCEQLWPVSACCLYCFEPHFAVRLRPVSNSTIMRILAQPTAV